MMLKTGNAILLVEDSPEDYEVTLRAFREAGLDNPLFRCSDGDEALDFLYRRGEYENPQSSPRPGMILLDLNLPGTDGREVLKEMKADDRLKTIPVIVLSTSADEKDVDSSYRAGANSYIQKPVRFSRFVQSVRCLKEFWFETALLPREEDIL